MDPSNFIHLHCKKQQAVFSENLSILKKGINIDAVHDLRVAFKKLRAYLALFSELSGKKDWKKYIPLSLSLFSILGKYRDLQVNLHWLSETEKEYKTKYRSIKKFLRAAIPEARKRIDEVLKEYPDNELPDLFAGLEEQIKSYTETELIEKIRILFSERIEEIARKIKDIKSEAHAVRKELKVIYYWLVICPTNSIISPSNLKSLDKVLEQLGNWQDHWVLLRKIKVFRKEFLPRKTTENKEYGELQKKLKHKNKTALESINDQIEQWLKDLPAD